ncbi:hypothetical protein BC832DRAFT_556303 [Gaertneriomyces semiglobifer]|nr:hypothetical protein BC832DRAFT_556303 [Gaertneriomyces semiglobifer]
MNHLRQLLNRARGHTPPSAKKAKLDEDNEDDTVMDVSVVPDTDHDGLLDDTTKDMDEQEKERYLVLRKYYFTLVSADDIVHEEECLRNPYSVKVWLRYINHKRTASLAHRVFIYERATRELPGSYKLWKAYLDLRVSTLFSSTRTTSGMRKCKLPPTHSEWANVKACFERCLVLCNKYPVIWKMYCEFMMEQPHRFSEGRRIFDRALRSLPITQHGAIWELYLKFVERIGGETVVRIWRRYLQLEPNAAEDFVSVLKGLDPPRIAEAARILAKVLETPKFESKRGKTEFQLWMELCELVTESPEIDDEDEDEENQGVNSHGAGANSITNKSSNHITLNADRLIRTGIARFTDQVGRLWNALAKYYMLQSQFDVARDIYEEALASVTTVRDFSLLFDAYAAMEEMILTRTMQQVQDGTTTYDEIDIDLRLKRFEKLMERRPVLVNDVWLRQNPQNVVEWENRVQIFKDREDRKSVLETYHKATTVIHPKRAVGKFHQLWIHYAQYYESLNEIDSARGVFDKAVCVNFKKVDELAEVWCAYADFELRCESYEAAVEVMGRATTPPRGNVAFHNSIRYGDETKDVQLRVFKSLKLWSHYVDLEEALGSLESTRAVYDRILELKIATPQTIMNYALFLETHRFFEESYKVYERGVEVFGYPLAFEIWNVYLTKFVQRYKGEKVERTRDLFEHALLNCPAKFAKSLYLMYAKYEEDYGMTRHALRIYDRATSAVADSDKPEIYRIYIEKATQFFGLPSTREIYERAISTLPDKFSVEFSVRFIEMETSLGEIDRARAVFIYASQMCDPKVDEAFWKRWMEWEVRWGSEESVREMLRVKRGVIAKWGGTVSGIGRQLLSGQNVAVTESKEPTSMAELEMEAMKEKERENTRVVGFVRAETTEKVHQDTLSGDGQADNGINPDEIAIESDSESEDENEGTDSAETRNMDVDMEALDTPSVPKAVFGGLAEKVQNGEVATGESLGAKERFKRKR